MAIDVPLPNFFFDFWVGLQDGCTTALIGYDIIIYSHIDRFEFRLYFWKIVNTG